MSTLKLIRATIVSLVFVVGVAFAWCPAASRAQTPPVAPAPPGVVEGVSGAVAVVAGGSHTCALLTSTRRDGASSVVCWGANASGQLGDGTHTAQQVPVPVPRIVALEVAVGGDYTCGRGTAGRVGCWGNNTYGQLGGGTRGRSAGLTEVVGLTDAVEIAVGDNHSCARRATGGVACWGSREHDVLGDAPASDGTYSDGTEAVQVAGLTDAVELAVGHDHTCARRASGAISCWGRNPDGELGTGARDWQLTPVAVPGITDAIGIAAGRAHTCALHATGTISCWGNNDVGQLGDGTTTTRLSPTPVVGLADVRAITAANGHTCALLETGAVSCWGWNHFGELGDVTTTNRSTPAPVAGVADVVEISAGSDHTCARVRDGTVSCWGAWSAVGRAQPISLVPAPLVAPPTSGATASSTVDTSVFMFAYDARITQLLAARGVEWHDAAVVPAGRTIRDQRLAIVDATVRLALPAILDAVPSCHECQRVAAELRLLPDLRSPERMARFRQAALLARDGRAREAAPTAWFRWLHGALAEAADAATDDVTAVERTALTIARLFEAGTRAESDATATAALATTVVTTAAAWDGSLPPAFRAAQSTYITADDVDVGHRYADRARAIACESVRPYLAIVLDQIPAATPTAHDRPADYGYVALDALVRVVLAGYLADVGLDESAVRLRALAEIRGPTQARAASTFIESGFIREEYDRTEGLPAISAVFDPIDSVANTIGPPSIWAHATEAQRTLEDIMQERLPALTAIFAARAMEPGTEYAAIVDVYARLLGVGASR